MNEYFTLCCEYLTKTYIFHDYSELPILFNSLSFFPTKCLSCFKFSPFHFSLSHSQTKREFFLHSNFPHSSLLSPPIFPAFLHYFFLVEIERKFEIKVCFLHYLISNILSFQLCKKLNLNHETIS